MLTERFGLAPFLFVFFIPDGKLTTSPAQQRGEVGCGGVGGGGV